ncbi:hypothetical protein OPV22_024664 [Ensete ventricosum]|uniref:BHLH domain-containing protein n=1 Tax=Ensete ventricosum TaxID=4639 RepID=A0AAV8P8V4_ENSVE|nr:hypothetical protein OPV22_024664 [Ensete ventricosum]
MNSGSSDRTPGCFLNQNWERSVDHISQFGSFMSPQSSSELERGLQRLDHLTEEILPQSHFMDSSGNSQALGGLVIAGNRALAHLDQFPADPGFAARAARFSSFDGQSYGWFSGHFELPGSGKPSTAAIIQSLTASGLQIGHLECNRQIPVSDGLQSKMNSAGPAISREETSLSDPISASNAKKRKAPSRSREKGAASPKPSTDPPKVADEEDSDTKRCRSSEKTHEIGIDNVKPKLEQNDGARSNGNDEQKQRKEGNDKPCEPPKDYIHVRARRGQATDSHSLAERVRREKISQRMKLLQDLVPGCSKVTGKAVMLDEIINYVQSLQRQVEFLSMKLATVNPQLDFDNLVNLHAKDMIQLCGSLPNSAAYSSEMSMVSSYADVPQQRGILHCIATNGMDFHCAVNMLDTTGHQDLNAHQASLGGFGDPSSQQGFFWEDDLQNIVQMGIGQDQEIVASSHNLHGGTSQAAQMKIEL